MDYAWMTGNFVRQVLLYLKAALGSVHTY